ncbi:MAG: STAS domain-containing protein [Planctomycetaceae bacterium]
MNSGKIETEVVRGVTVVTFTDDTMMEDNVRDTHPEIDALIEPGIAVLWDLSGMKYVSSAFIGMFVSTMKKIRAAEGRFALCELSPFVTEVFAPLPHHSPDLFFTDRSAAIEALAGDE